MLRTTRQGRRLALAATALLGSAALAVSTAVPAGAVSISDWTTGYVPQGAGCTVTAGTYVAPDLQLTYADTVVPSVVGWGINGKTTYALLVPGLQTLTFSARVKQGCGGLQGSGGGLFLRITNGPTSNIFPFNMASTTTNPFDQTFANSFTGDASYAGMYQVPAAVFQKRFDTFTLNSTDFSYVSSTADTSDAPTLTGPWSTQRTYLLLKTTVSTSASRSTVPAGGNVTFRATLKKAGLAAYVPAAGSKVVLQTRVGTGSWVTRATRTASATGAVSFTFAPSRTMSWRWVHVGEKTSLYTAPVTSTVKRITVT